MGGGTVRVVDRRQREGPPMVATGAAAAPGVMVPVFLQLSF